MVEIEVHSYCNRRCWFCPNWCIDRRSSTEYMDEDMYLEVMDRLAACDYRGMVSYSRYNEPLADPVIFKRIRQAAERIPHATLHTNTNGDYLTRKVLDQLRGSGLDSLKIQCYLGPREEFTVEAIRTMANDTCAELGLPYTVRTKKPGELVLADVEYPGMNVEIYGRNFRRTGTNRGGLLKSVPGTCRTQGCGLPFTDIYIDYTGYVMPCCNLRSDSAEHATYITGDLNRMSLFDAYWSDKIINWRKHCKDPGVLPPPCRSCSMARTQDVAGWVEGRMHGE
jgi:MoaA/NifB/PqqE/SkfB family radical SAM enzyme